MKNILKIFHSDLKGIFTHIFALVIAIGISALPALYAWFNIYANWDPYGNTGNIQIAAAIEDAGWTDENGNNWNIGSEVAKDLAASQAIDWTFVDSEEEAKEGVRSGQYYAAVSIGKDFSRYMFDDQYTVIPQLNYYVNGKKNAVATKITDTAVGNVQTSINEKYISIVSGELFSNVKTEAGNSKVKTTAQKFIDDLIVLRDNLADYDQMIDSFTEGNEKLSVVLTDTSAALEGTGEKLSGESEKLSSHQESLQDAEDSFNAFCQNVSNVLLDIEGRLSDVANGVSAAQMETDAAALKERLNEMFPYIQDLKDKSDALVDLFMEIDAKEISWKAVSDRIQTLQNMISILEENATKTAATAAAEDLADNVGASLAEMGSAAASASSMLTGLLMPSVDQLLEGMSSSMESLQNVLADLGSSVYSLSDMFVELNNTGDILNTSMSDLHAVLDEAGKSLTSLIEKMDDTVYSTQVDLIAAFLSGDAKTIGNYFAEPVVLEDTYIYPIENYGSGVSPFYTVLAIWVGMTILVSVLKANPDEKKFPGAKRCELFLGRYLLFLLLSEIQTVVIVIGELKFFGIQCLYPGRYLFAGMIASLTISLIVYSLTVSFGDIGKAIAIVALVIQIAGSGGTYPIEILPGFFRTVYRLFPFPYVIDAMRECIGGMYENTYVKCLMILGVFCAGALVLGLLIRLPLIAVNKYVEKRLEDSEIL